MAYSNTGLSLAVSSIGDAPKIFTYSSTDIHTTVAGASYFTDGTLFGMEVNDVVYVIRTGATDPGVTVHTVASVSGTAVTLNAAILA